MLDGIGVALENHVRVNIKVRMARRVSNSGLGQDLLIGQLQMIDRRVIGPIERFQDGIRQEPLTDGVRMEAVEGKEIVDGDIAEGERRQTEVNQTE